MRKIESQNLSELKKIILEVLQEMDAQAGTSKALYGRWLVQEEVCKKYMEHFGMAGYESEKMSDNILDHPEWESNPRFKDFFTIERGTDLQGKSYCYLKNASLFSSAFYRAISGMFKEGLVTIDILYERKKAGCCGYTENKNEIVNLPKELSGIQKIGLTDRAFSVL
jgi:hypothetical protein